MKRGTEERKNIPAEPIPANCIRTLSDVWRRRREVNIVCSGIGLRRSWEASAPTHQVKVSP